MKEAKQGATRQPEQSIIQIPIFFVSFFEDFEIEIEEFLSSSRGRRIEILHLYYFAEFFPFFRL